MRKSLIINTKTKLVVKSKEIIAENFTPINNKKINKNIFNSSKKIEKNISKNVSGIVKISNDHLEKSVNNNKLQSNFLNFSKNQPVIRK